MGARLDQARRFEISVCSDVRRARFPMAAGNIERIDARYHVEILSSLVA